MHEYGTPDLIGAWIISQLWERKPRWASRPEMAFAALPVTMDERAFESGRQILVDVGLIDRSCRLTALGREAMSFPGPNAPSYCQRFKEALEHLRPGGLETTNIARTKSCLIAEFSDSIYLAEMARRRLAEQV